MNKNGIETLQARDAGRFRTCAVERTKRLLAAERCSVPRLYSRQCSAAAIRVPGLSQRHGAIVANAFGEMRCTWIGPQSAFPTVPSLCTCTGSGKAAFRRWSCHPIGLSWGASSDSGDSQQSCRNRRQRSTPFPFSSGWDEQTSTDSAS